MGYELIGGVLWISAFLTFGIGDTLSTWWANANPLIYEGNAFADYVIQQWGYVALFALKVALLWISYVVLQATPGHWLTWYGVAPYSAELSRQVLIPAAIALSGLFLTVHNIRLRIINDRYVTYSR